MPSPVTADLTVEDIDAHLKLWVERRNVADRNSMRTMSERAIDNWLKLRFELTERQG
jgi:hypothetical protein